MGVKDLNVLGNKENRLFLVIVIWFVILFTITSFNPIVEINIILYIPLLAVCIILFMISFLFRKDLREDLTKGMFLKYSLISIIFIAIFFSLASVLLILIFFISILSYIFITSLFTMAGCYNKGISFDEKLYKIAPWPINFILRTIVLVGGLLFAFLLFIIFAIAGTAWALASEDVASIMAIIPWIMIIIMIGLCALSFLFLIIGRYNAWLGVFFVWVGFYSIYLMIKAFTKAGGGSTGGGTYGLPLPIQIALYIFDLYLVLGTIGSLIGKKADKIASGLEKIPLIGKMIRPDGIIIWLIFSKVAYEFANSIPDTAVSSLKATLVFILFIPLFLITGLYGMYQYGKLKKGWKQDKKDAKAEKKLKKDIKKGRIDASALEKPIYCSNCGTSNERTGKFCKSCGAELKK
ncbi:MAG: hypothetical protein ACTSR8_16180 [Promethearchaeota archaeon]